MAFDRRGTLSLNDERGHVLLGGVARESFGVCGAAWMLQFQPDLACRFYEMGEKLGALEKTGTRTKFWNIDVMADFAASDIDRGITDPMYVSVPWLVVKRQGRYLGVLVDNPYAVFMSANGRIGSSAGPQDAQTRIKFYLGSDKGLPDVWVIAGPDLPSLTRKYQRLVGTTPCHRSGPWAITSAVGATPAPRICGAYARVSASAASPTTVSGSTSTICRTSRSSPLARDTSGIPPSRLSNSRLRVSTWCPSWTQG